MWLERYFRFAIRHRAIVLVVCLVLTALSGWQISRGAFATSLIKSFLGDTSSLARYRELRARFGGGDLMAIAFEDDALFTEAGWARLQRIEAAVERLPFVLRAYGLPDGYRIVDGPGGLELIRYGELARHAKDHEALRHEVLSNRPLVRTLVAPDGCCTMLLVELRPYDEEPVEDMAATLEALLAPFLAEGLPPERLHLAGLYAETVEGVIASRHSVMVIFPLTAIILLAAVFLLSGRLVPVAITGLVALCGTAWTFAVSVALDREINLLMAMVPAVTMIISFSDVIHLFARYQHLLARGLGKLDAIGGSAQEVGGACVYNSLTNAAGFISMAMIPAPVFRAVGLALAIGVVLALLAGLTLVPILLFWTPTPAPGRAPRFTWPQRLLDAVVKAAARLALRRPWWIIGGFGLLTALSLLSLERLSFETSMVDRLSYENRLQRARRFIRAHFDGTTVLEIYGTSTTEDFLEPRRYAELGRFARALEQIEGVDDAQSFADVVEPLRSVLSSTMAAGSDEPTRAMLTQAVLLAESSGDTTMDRLLGGDRRSFRIVARLGVSGMAETAAIGRRVEALAAVLLPDVVVESSGLSKLFGDWIDEIIEGQKRGLWLAVLATTLTMVVCFRRVRTGLVSMIPNLVPIAVVGGVLALINPVRDSDLVVIAMITVGTVVDDTIHLVFCLLEEAEKTSNLDEAIERALGLTGRSMLQATLVLCAGFLPFALSSYSTTRHMGTLLPLVLGMAAASELLLTPALAKVGALGIRASQRR